MLLFFVSLISVAAVVAAELELFVDSPHRVGLADSRIGYESETYRTDSKVVIEVSGIRQALDKLSTERPFSAQFV